MDKRISRLAILKEELVQIPMASYPDDPWTNFHSWVAKATPIIRRDWSDFWDDFQKVSAKPKHTSGIMFLNRDLTISEHEHHRLWKIDSDEFKGVKQNTLHFLDGILTLPLQIQHETVTDKVLFICRRFPIFAQQLKVRERGRLPFEIEDEYDVQYLFLALLRLHFEDVRKEVWTPNYAGGSARMDFVLKREKIVIETKKTRDSLNRDSQVGDQLIVDIERYSQYPDCQVLICFVYDPDSLLDNPKGLELDLSGPRENIEVIVIISPSGI